MMFMGCVYFFVLDGLWGFEWGVKVCKYWESFVVFLIG